MATQASNPSPIEIDGKSSARLWLLLLGAAFVLAAFVTPWWTRGINFDADRAYDPDNEEGFDGDWGSGAGAPGTEGVFWHYGPFSTPEAVAGGSSLDASRETVTMLLGVAMVTCVLLLATSLTLRWLRTAGRVSCSATLPVTFAIGAFGFGVAAVLIGALFVPLMGSNPGLLYGEEQPSNIGELSDGIIEMTRYANAGFFAGIVGLVALPVYVWVDAAAARQAEETGMATGRATTRGPVPVEGTAARARKATPSLE